MQFWRHFYGKTGLKAEEEKDPLAADPKTARGQDHLSAIAERSGGRDLDHGLSDAAQAQDPCLSEMRGRARRRVSPDFLPNRTRRPVPMTGRLSTSRSLSRTKRKGGTTHETTDQRRTHRPHF